MNRFIIRRLPSARFVAVAALGPAALLFLILLFRRPSSPLLWNDEGETAMYAERMLEFGYPEVHDGRSVVYALVVPFDVAVKQPMDAYIRSPWGQYYVGAVGAALARSTDNPYEKTFWLRLPFAVAGAAAIAILAVTLLMILRPQPSRGGSCGRVQLDRCDAATTALAPSRGSLLLGRNAPRRSQALCETDLPEDRLGTPEAGTNCVLATLLAAVFHVFSAASIGLLATMAINTSWSSALAPPAIRLRRIGRGLLPIVVAGILVVPGLLFFVAAWSRRLRGETRATTSEARASAPAARSRAEAELIWLATQIKEGFSERAAQLSISPLSAHQDAASAEVAVRVTAPGVPPFVQRFWLSRGGDARWRIDRIEQEGVDERSLADAFVAAPSEALRQRLAAALGVPAD